MSDNPDQFVQRPPELLPNPQGDERIDAANAVLIANAPVIQPKEITNADPTSAPGPVAHAPELDPIAAMRAMMEEVMAPMKTHMAELEAENKRLREIAEKKDHTDFADNVPFHLRSDDPLVPVGDDRFGRRVVLGTAAADAAFVAREIPHARGRIVNHGGLVKNTIQNVLGEGGSDSEEAPH
jgi:hypothetical protein